MRILIAALAASSLATGVAVSAASAADAPDSYYEDRESDGPRVERHVERHEERHEERHVERHVERRVVVEEPGWRRVEIEEPIVEERVVVRRRVVEDGPPRWRRARLHEDRGWDGRRGGRIRNWDDDAGW